MTLPLLTTTSKMVCSDYFTIYGKDYVVLVDRFSNWPIMFESKGLAPGLVRELQAINSTFCAPKEMASDEGTPNMASITQSFLSDWGARDRLSSVANPNSNTRSELGVKQVKRIMMENVSTTGSLHEDAFAKAILSYRNTPCPLTKASPAMLLFGWSVRDMISVPVGTFSLHPSLKEMLHHYERA